MILQLIFALLLFLHPDTSAPCLVRLNYSEVVINGDVLLCGHLAARTSGQGCRVMIRNAVVRQASFCPGVKQPIVEFSTQLNP